MTREKRVFLSLFLYGVVFQFATRGAGDLSDTWIWAEQIQFFLERDPRVFDLFGAYGHPGTTLIELGSLFHGFFGVSYIHATMLSMSILIAGATAACATICLSLFPRSIWWLTTAFILLLDRPYFGVTPTTAIVIPLTTLSILTMWWLWVQRLPQPPWRYFLLGAIIGLTAATRLDTALPVGSVMIAIIWYRFGLSKMLAVLAGAVIAIFVFDPFLWFMPIRHLADLIRKFTLHYDTKIIPTGIESAELIRGLALSALSSGWSLVLLVRRRLSRIVPIPVIIGCFIISVFTLAVVLSSSTQSLRYLAPLIVLWEIFLPLLVLETFVPTTDPDRQSNGLSGIQIPSKTVIGLLILMQVLTSLVFRPHLISRIFSGMIFRQ